MAMYYFMTGSVLMQDLEAGSIYGLEKLWAFFHYAGGIPQDSDIELNAEVGPPVCFGSRSIAGVLRGFLSSKEVF